MRSLLFTFGFFLTLGAAGASDNGAEINACLGLAVIGLLLMGIAGLLSKARKGK